MERLVDVADELSAMNEYLFNPSRAELTWTINYSSLVSSFLKFGRGHLPSQPYSSATDLNFRLTTALSRNTNQPSVPNS